MPNPAKDVGLGGIAVQAERLRALREDTVKSLMESMAVSGLLQPVVLRPKESAGFWLVAGRHRLEAARRLKWESISATIFEGMDADQAELAEIDENLIRADLSPAERAMHTDARKTLYEKVHPETKHGAVGRGGKKSPQNEESFTRDTAKKTGKSRQSVEREARRGREGKGWLKEIACTSLDHGDEIDALIELSENARAPLIERAKSGEKVSAKTAVKQHKREQIEKKLAKSQTALPQKKYGVILADPEWRFEPWSRESGMDRAADNHYPTSPIEDIKARDVASIAADDCSLFLWATVPMLPQALAVMAAWGFEYKSHCIWNKNNIGNGYWFRNKHELLLIGTRGNIPAPAPGTQWASVIDAPIGKHSEKPERFLEMIEAYFPNLPKIELNAREARAGWDCWGLEAPDSEEAA